MNTLTKAEQQVTEQELNDLIIDAIQDIKGKNIIKLDLNELHDAPTNNFIICEGDSTVQVKAISENIKLRLKKELGEFPVNSLPPRDLSHFVVEDLLDLQGEHAPDLEGQRQRRIILAVLNRDDGLARHAEPVPQRLLGQSVLATQLADAVLHAYRPRTK